MPQISDQSSNNTSEYNQASFLGGMNLALDDTHLDPTQYRIGFNVRNRYDRLDPVLSSVKDVSVPYGVVQELVTFGNYELIFVDGHAYYKLYTDTIWTQVQGFGMSATAPRYWTEAIPVATTNYLRMSSTVATAPANARAAVNVNNITGAAGGNLPGLLVQDNINQPQFIFIGPDGVPICRTTQTFAQWHITFTDAFNTVVATNGDQREYVPVGNLMKYTDGILYITSPDGQKIFRSVSGRPLDFVVNVTNKLADGTTTPPFTQYGGGDASTTSYSVGLGPITCLHALSDGSLFVAAGNANFAVSKDKNNISPLEFGEFTFIRTFLFNGNCLSDRAIIDTLGDTRFIGTTGVRSFNAIEQEKNEGRNSVFTSTIQGVFLNGKGANAQSITQDSFYSAAILYDDFELYAVNTIFGPAIAVYDTLRACWVGLDVGQTQGKRVKQLVKIELAAQALFAVTEDNAVYRLYVGPSVDAASFRTVGVCSGLLYAGEEVKMANPKMQVKLSKTRVILNNITQNSSCSFTPYVNNRMSSVGKATKNIPYTNPTNPTTGTLALSDVDTMLKNLLFTTPDCEQGWKVFGLFEWTGGSVTQFSMELTDQTPENPFDSQDESNSQ